MLRSPSDRRRLASLPLPPVQAAPKRAMVRAAALLLAVAAGALLAAPVDAQQPVEPALFSGVDWRTIGPAVVGGRISDIAVVESDPRVLYIGTATGGVWKTTSHGAEWRSIFDDQATSSIGAVSVAPSNPNMVWVGTGEPQNRQSSPWGAGVYRSTDAGRTWTHVGLTETRHVGGISIHPREPSTVYVAAVGELWDANPERGVYRTTDGGATWQKVLFIDEDTGAIDLVMHPTDPNTLFAAMYQRRRTAWGFNGGGPGSGIYKTTDGGDTWRELTDGLPEGDKGRVGLDIYRGDGDLVIATVEAAGDEGGFYASTDGGETWEKRSDTNPRPMYFSLPRIDPNDPERIYLGGASLVASSDGGRTFEVIGREVHPDHHAFWIDPENSNHIISGNDGGISVSFDRGENWRMYDNLPLAQFYEIGVDLREPYYVCGGLQDNGSWCGPSDTWSSQGIRNADWYNIGGGDGFYAQIDPTDHTVLYAESQNGNVFRLNVVTGERLRVRPLERPRPPYGQTADPDGVDYRYNWNTPIQISRHEPGTVYFGAQVLLKSTDRGLSWRQISPDLTRGIDRDTLPIMARRPADGRFLSQHDGVSSYGTLTTISESPLDPAILYTGADDGSVHGTRDGGATWTDISANFPELPPLTYVSRVLASRQAPGTVYVTFDGHYSGDFRPHVYVSRDFGQSFRRIVDGLPAWSVNIIAEHPETPALLFTGNEVGAYVSIDAGAQWTPLESNLPTVPVDDILVHPRDNDLVLGTHGRGIWIMEDIAFLERLTPQVLASRAFLFPTKPAVLAIRRGAQAWVPAEFSAPGPRPGARIRYYLGADLVSVSDESGPGPRADAPFADAATAAIDAQPADSSDSLAQQAEARFTILDAEGDVVAELDGQGTRGIHEVTWDLELDPPGGAGGVPALPGRYVVRMHAAGQTPETELVVEPDPRVEYDAAAARERYRLALAGVEIEHRLEPAADAADSLITLVEAARDLLRARPAAPDSLRRTADQLLEQLEDLDDQIGDVQDDASAVSSVAGGSYDATEDMVWQLERARTEAPGVVDRLNQLIRGPVPSLLRAVYQPAVMPRVPEPVVFSAG